MKQDRISNSDHLPKVVLEVPEISRAYELAESLHRGQTRKSGEPYIVHPVAVMNIMSSEWGIDKKSILQAALLHDVVEDTTVTIEQISKEYGAEVAEMVLGVTNLASTGHNEESRKVVVNAYLNPAVALIKLADRLHNMRTMEHMPAEKQKKKAEETLKVYTGLAMSLGLWKVKVELEDWCYQYLDPQGYAEAKNLRDKDLRSSESFVENIKSSIAEHLASSGVNATIGHRINGVYALKEKWRKQMLAGTSDANDFGDIEDLTGIRIKVQKKEDIWRVLSEIHEKYGQNVDIDKLDVYLGAHKRLNGYEAVQTTINLPQGPVEIAIMTEVMEEFNEWGVVSLIRSGKEEELKKYRLKIVFTPRGSIRFLGPKDTAYDFARVLSLGLLREGRVAIVDGEVKPMSTVIPNGAMVKIAAGETKARVPDVGAELYCSPATRQEIEKMRLREEGRGKVIEKGRLMAEEVLKERGLLVITDVEVISRRIFLRFGCQTREDLYVKMANGAITPEILQRELDVVGATREKLNLSTIRIGGTDGPGILVRLTQELEKGKRNIVKISHNNDGKRFDLRLVVVGLTEEEKIKISEILNETSGLEGKLIV